MASREVLAYRRDAEKALRLAGSVVLHRRAYNVLDFEDGTVGHCPVCWSDEYSNPTDSVCPTCFGTGFYPAYGEKQVLWASIDVDIDSKISEGDPSGVNLEYGNTLRVSYPPILQSDDLVAQVIDDNMTVSAVYSVDGEVNRRGLMGVLSNSKNGVLTLDDSCVGQSANLMLLFPDDMRTAQGFWDEP